MIESAKHFADYAQKVCNINVLYLASSEINSLLVNDSCYIPGTLKIHHQVRRVTANEVEFYYNSQYKKASEMLSKVLYLQTEVNKSNSDDDEEENILQANTSLQVGDVVVKYETKRKVLTYLGVVQSVNGEFLQVQYLKGSVGKTFTLKEGDQDEII